MFLKASAFCLILVPTVTFSQARIAGQVQIEAECEQNQTMVWLSQTLEGAETLLLHTLVPHLGSYAFSVKPGIYHVEAQTPSGCKYQNDEVKVEKNEVLQLDLEIIR